jgi:hypothetical protein
MEEILDMIAEEYIIDFSLELQNAVRHGKQIVPPNRPMVPISDYIHAIPNPSLSAADSVAALVNDDEQIIFSSSRPSHLPVPVAARKRRGRPSKKVVDKPIQPQNNYPQEQLVEPISASSPSQNDKRAKAYRYRASSTYAPLFLQKSGYEPLWNSTESSNEEANNDNNNTVADVSASPKNVDELPSHQLIDHSEREGSTSSVPLPSPSLSPRGSPSPVDPPNEPVEPSES